MAGVSLGLLTLHDWVFLVDVGGVFLAKARVLLGEMAGVLRIVFLQAGASPWLAG